MAKQELSEFFYEVLRNVRDIKPQGSAETVEQKEEKTEEAITGGSSKAKSIAEKLGFMNFDDDEFDTPSYLRKEDGPSKQV